MEKKRVLISGGASLLGWLWAKARANTDIVALLTHKTPIKLKNYDQYKHGQ